MQSDLKKFLNYQPIFEEEKIDEFFEKEVKTPVVDYL